jgi:hypothetical protein
VTHPAPPSIPTPGVVVPTDQVTAVISNAQKWSSETGARLLDLDAVLGTLPATQRQDHTLAFVLWQATEKVVQEARNSQSAFADHRLGPLRKPIVDADGSQLATNFYEAGTIIGALIDSTQHNLDAQAGALAATSEISNDLAICSPLVKSLSMSASLFSQLVQRSSETTLMDDPVAAAKLSNEVAQLRKDLQVADQERTALIAAQTQDETRLAALQLLEIEARSLMEKAMQKVTNVPRRGVVSVDALGAAPNLNHMVDTPWPAQRNILAERAKKLARAEQSLREVISAHTGYLAERNELRQMVDAFRAKAMAGHIGEVPEVSVAYAAAKALLWSAPTDLVAARAAVAEYQRVVTVTARSTAQPTHTASTNSPTGGIPR